MTTYASAETLVRYRLDETTARKWSSAQIVNYLSNAERHLAGTLSRIPKTRRFRVIHESGTNAANTETFDLTGLAKTFDWLICVSIVVGNVEVPLWNYEDGDAPWLRNLGLGGGLPVSRIDLQDTNLVLLPKYGQARTLYFDYGWIPLAKTSTSDTLETPAVYDDAVVLRATIDALADAGIRNEALEQKYVLRVGEIEDLERSRRGISNERVIRRGREFSRCR